MNATQKRKFDISLKAEFPEVVGFVDGYLTGMHDAHQIRQEPLPGAENMYRWRIDVLESACAFNTMTAADVQRELMHALIVGLSYRGMRGAYSDFELHVE